MDVGVLNAHVSPNVSCSGGQGVIPFLEKHGAKTQPNALAKARMTFGMFGKAGFKGMAVDSCCW